MADYANALVRFKAKSKYCDAIEQVFNKRLKKVITVQEECL